MTYSIRQNKYTLKQVILALVSILILLGIAGYFGFQYVYKQNLQAIGTSSESQLIEIEQGATTQAVAEMLEQKQLIKASWAFSWYMRSEGLRSEVQAGTFALSPGQSVQEIAAVITGSNREVSNITILPEKRIDEIRVTLINNGFSPEEVDEALDPSSHQGHPALSEKPADATLEGYIYPETFAVEETTTAQEVISWSLDEMASRLTPDVRDAIKEQGLSVHEGIILASIVEREVGVENPEDRPQVAQVFISRLEIGMKLESNATTRYGAILRGDEATYSQQNDVTYSTPYNTYENEGLPPSPVSNVLATSIEAVAYPADTDYLYFVSADGCLAEVDEPCVNYFSNTLEEHERLVRQHCQIRCSPN